MAFAPRCNETKLIQKSPGGLVTKAALSDNLSMRVKLSQPCNNVSHCLHGKTPPLKVRTDPVTNFQPVIAMLMCTDNADEITF